LFPRIYFVLLAFFHSEKVIPETVVIFADEFLLRLPLESLEFLKNSQVQCVARDFSLQMHYHRFHSNEVSGIIPCRLDDVFKVGVFDNKQPTK
jgi:hypothetical protein